MPMGLPYPNLAELAAVMTDTITALQEDPESFKQARATERYHIRKWVKQVARRNAGINKERGRKSRISRWTRLASSSVAKM